MAKIHIMGGVGRQDTYQIIIHTSVPTGSNSAGVLWSDALKSTGRARTIMTEGAGPGQITPEEKALVEAGTLFETVGEMLFDPTWTNAQRNAAIDAEAQNQSSAASAAVANALKYFGATRG
jgi:hypothetical protein